MLFDAIRGLQRRVVDLEGSTPWRCALLVLGALAIMVSVGWVAREVAGNGAWPAGADMHLYLDAADAILQGRSPYAPSAEAFHRYPYPPLFADVLAVLTALFGHAGAAGVWIVLQAVALVAVAVLLTRRGGVSLAIPWVVLICGALFVARAARSDLYHGQLNFLLLLLLLAGFLCWRQGRSASASGLWAVMICCKPFLGIVVFFLLRQRDWRTAALTVGMSGVLFALSFLPAHQDIFGAVSGWRETTQHYASPEWAANPLNESFYALLLRLFTENDFSRAWLDAPVLIPIGLGLVAPIALAAMFAGAPGDARSEDASLALLRLSAFMAAFMSLGPVTEGNHLYYLLPGAAGAFALAWRRIAADGARQGWWLATALAWLAVAVVPLSPIRLPVSFSDPSTWDALHGPGVLLSGWFAIALLSAGVISALVLELERRDVTKPSPQRHAAVATGTLATARD